MKPPSQCCRISQISITVNVLLATSSPSSIRTRRRFAHKDQVGTMIDPLGNYVIEGVGN
jgi:hypothetical protein